jgi:hypothetical protein
MFRPSRLVFDAKQIPQCPLLALSGHWQSPCLFSGGKADVAIPGRANREEWMRLILAALLLMLLTPTSAHASCATMQALAQEHANDMARRGSMDHSGFASRARRGARAENVAYGVKTKQQAIALWWGSIPGAGGWHKADIDDPRENVRFWG